MSDTKWLITGGLALLIVGVIAGALGLRSCTPEPKTETIVETRIDTIPGPADSVRIVVHVPVRVPYALPPDSSDLRLWQQYTEGLLADNDRLRARLDTLENIEAVAVTEAPGALLTAHLNMPEFRRDPKRGLWAEAIITSHDTTRTTTNDCSLTFWRRFGIGLYGGLGYDAMNNAVGANVGAGLLFRIY